LENMVGANGKVGPNPGLVSIEYTKWWWNAQFKKRQTSCIVIQWYIKDSIRGFPRSLYKYPLKPGTNWETLLSYYLSFQSFGMSYCLISVGKQIKGVSSNASEFGRK
jgi:hypothetical protein